LLKFKGKINLAVGDSEHNVSELKQMGFDGCLSIPILLDYEKFAVQPDREILAKYKSPGWVNWLFVGRVFPNKKQEDIIKAFYFFKKYIRPASRLILVGSYKDMPLYHEYLRYFVDKLGLRKDVILTGGVSESELAAYYQAADLFMCMSEHEGFCVPLIEAIHAGVPVMAFDSTAVPETLGDTGVLIKEKRFPEIAELARYVLENTDLRNKIVEEQKTRLQVYSREAVLQQWQQAIGNFY
jgi:glycosyltransferase involved in cell wall biosynthesis